MNEIAVASLNSFAPAAEQAVPTEEPVFILTSSQLQEIISKATNSLNSRVEALEDRIISQDEKIATLEATQETQADNQLIQLRLIHDIRKKNPGKTEISRAEKIEKYLASRPDHKATFETLKGHLGVDKFRLNEAVKTLMASDPGRYGITRISGDKRKRTLVMLPK